MPPDGAVSEYDLVRDVPTHPGCAHSTAEQLRGYLSCSKEPTPSRRELDTLRGALFPGVEQVEHAILACHGTDYPPLNDESPPVGGPLD
jgi:hypothetical protein